MNYTILQLAKLAGVSTRTLRYYDQIGLLIPLRDSASKYRIYGEHEVDILQHILFYKELGFELSTIKEMIQNPCYNRKNALKKHLETLKEKEQTIKLLIQTVAKTIQKEEGILTMNNDEKFIGLKKSMIEQNETEYGEEIRQKYGEDTISKSNRKFMNLSKEEYNAMQAMAEKISLALENAIRSGLTYEGTEGHDIAQMHKEWLGYTWTSYSVTAHHGLTDMYVADERFKHYYDKELDGCAQFLRDAVHYHIR